MPDRHSLSPEFTGHRVWIHGILELGKCIEQAPGIAGSECLVFRLAPLVQDIRDVDPVSRGLIEENRFSCMNRR